MKTTNAPEPLQSGSGVFSADGGINRTFGLWRIGGASQTPSMFPVHDH